MSRAKPRHGTLSGYRNLNCRCEPCREAQYRWRKRNRVIGSTLVDASPVKAHIRLLVDNGWTRAEISRCAHVSPGLVKWLADDDTRRRTHADKAERILALTPNRSRASEPPSHIGIQRRVQALAVMGWRQIDLAALLNTTQSQIHILSTRRATAVTSGTATRVAELYERLCMTPGPSNQATAKALRRGWSPPLAWENIDDPTETPAQVRRSTSIATEDIVEMVEVFGYTFEAVGRHLGMHERTVERRYHRARKKVAA